MEIKSCPLCASPAKTQKFALVFWLMRCTGCMLKLKDMHTSEDAVIKAWNTRLTDQDRRNDSPKRWSKEAFFEIAAVKTGEVLVRWLDDDTDITVMKSYGFTWDCYDRAREYGTYRSHSSKAGCTVELRYYQEV